MISGDETGEDSVEADIGIIIVVEEWKMVSPGFLFKMSLICTFAHKL